MTGLEGADFDRPDGGVPLGGQLLEIDPETGGIKTIDLPFNALDVAFDVNGLIYMRTTDVVARYDMKGWREVPWDYGSELAKVSSGMGGKISSVISGQNINAMPAMPNNDATISRPSRGVPKNMRSNAAFVSTIKLKTTAIRPLVMSADA